MARRPMRPIAAGRLPLLALALSALLLVLLVLLPRSAHAGWGGVDDHKDPRLAIKKPGTTRQVAPGQQFNVAINIKKAQRRVPALFEVVLPDGALFVGPTGHQPKQTNKGGFKGRTPAPTAETGWKKAKRAAAKRFPLPDTVVNGTAGERTLQWRLDTFPARFNPIKLTFEVDFCGASSPLALRLNWQQGGRSARPAVITLNVSPSAAAPAAPDTFVDWSAPVPPYESLLLIACHRPDPANPGVCLECIDDPAWMLHGGRCVCAVGAGTHLTANTSAAGWTSTPPAPDGGCQQRELHPSLATGTYGPLSCDAANPRVIEAIYIDPPACVCRLCPGGFTSDGGNPAEAACFPDTGGLQSFGLLFGIKEEEEEAPATDGGRRRALAPLSVLDAASALASSWADVLSCVPESMLGALEPIEAFTLDGPVRPLETPVLTDRALYLFAVRYTFFGSAASRDAVVEAINGVAQDPAFTCASWVYYTGADMCALVRQALPEGYRLVNPWATRDPVPAPAGGAVAGGRSMQQQSAFAGAAHHRALFLPVVLNSLFLFGTKAFAGIGKGVDQYRASKSSGKPMALEGKAMFVDSAFQILGMAFGIWNLFGGSEDKYLPYLKQIDETTKETLDRVKELQVQIGNVQIQLDQIAQQLNQLLAEVQEDKCITANALVEQEINKLTPLWSEYYDGESSVLGTAISQMQYMTDYSFVEPSVQEALTAWATKVRTTVNVYAALNNIHRNLMGSGGVRGAVGACGQAFYTAWRVAKSIPLDDRQYYNPIITYLSDKIIYQAQGVRMIQDAYLILAMDAVRNRAKVLKQDIIVGAFAERSNICNIIIAAFNQNPASALAAGRSLCIDRSDFSAKIHNNIVQQIEYMGMPFSNGDAGEGVRLLLGSDITMTNAVLVNDASNPKNQTTFTSTGIKTRWLLPASLQAFDARCANQHDASQADAAGCSAVGIFRSCAYGCNLDSTREARWPADKYVLGYWGGNWTVANGTVWDELRGLLTGWMDNNTATGDAADVLALLEREFPIPNIYPFAGMTNRSFWIVNKTAAVQISDLAIDVIPKFKTWLSSKVTFSCDASRYEGPDDYMFPWFPREMFWPQAQCLAAYNPSQSKGDKARWAGATGVHCTSNDFAGLFKQWCIRNQPVCDGTHTFCNTTIKPELLQRFGAAMQPSNGKKGNMSAACRWDQFWTTDTDQYDLFGGSCHLGPPEERQPAWYGYGLEWGCEGATHPTTYYRKSSQYYWRADVACAPEFSYAWFPELWYRPKRDDPARKKVDGWPNPTDSATRPMFRLPALDITQIECTPSPFVNVPGNYGKKARARRNYNNLPTLCNDEFTQAVLSLVGPGDYEADAGNSYAELKLANDGDTITCNVTWDQAATPGVVTTNMYITVRDGPVYDTDRLDTTGNDTFPLWASFQADLYANATRTGGAPPQPIRTSISLSAALPRSMTSSATRIVGCTVVGEDPQTKLPITVFAVSKILPEGALPWEDFEYPIATKPCNVTDCISSVAKALGGPSLLATGPAAYLPGAGSRDALYVRVQDSPEGLLQVLPPLVNATHSLIAEAVYSTTSFVNTPSALPELMGWQVDGQGRLYTTGKVADGGYKSPVGFVAALDFSSPPARYTTTAKVQRAGIYSDIYCIQTSIQPYYVSFGGITSAWLEPASGDLFVVDAYCSAIYRVEASALQPNCASPGFCGTIHRVGPAYKSFYDIESDMGYFKGDHGKVSIVGDPARGLLYVAMSNWCRVVAFNLTTGAYVRLAAGTRGLMPYTNTCGFSGDGQLAAGANATRLSNNLGQIDVASNGDLYITDTGNHRVRRVALATGIITTVAGTGLAASLGDLRQAVNASLNAPRGVKYVETPDSTVAGGVRKLLYITEGSSLRRVLLN